MRKFKYADLASRLIAKSAYSHDPDSAEIVSAISELNSELFKSDAKLRGLKASTKQFCIDVAAYLANDKKTGDDLFDMYNKQAILMGMCDQPSDSEGGSE